MEKTILALDCSLRWTNAAIFRDGEVLTSERLDLGRRQSAGLPGVVKNVLDCAGISFEQVGLVAVTNGPGYFTGVRVGASYAAALAYGLGVKIAPVSTLHMLADSLMERTSRERKILVAVYAGRERVYVASFGSSDTLPAGEYGQDELESWLLVHEDAEVVSDDPTKAFLPRLGRDIQQVLPDAGQVARIAWQNPDNAVHPMELRVSYHRSPL